MLILKFGGTSVADAARIKKTQKIVFEKFREAENILTAVSAFAGVTDQLIQIGEMAKDRDDKYNEVIGELKDRHTKIISELFADNKSNLINNVCSGLFNELEEIIHGVYLLKELSDRSLDLIVSFGERLSASIIAAFYKQSGLPAEFIDARKIIKTNDSFGNARVKMDETRENIKNFWNGNKRLGVVTGFIASTAEGVTTTLGRGGSDFTASILGAALNADEIQIWTDVNGVMTTNPSKVPSAFSLEALSYEEAMELSHFGAKVLHPPTIQPALEQGIPVRILNTFNPDFQGTLIQKETVQTEQLLSGISSIDNIALLRLQGSGMVGIPGIASRLFSALAGAKVNVILISQASSEHSICTAVKPEAVRTAKRAIEKEFNLEIKAHMIDPVIIEKQLAIIAIVGENMRKRTGISGRLFEALGSHKINVMAVAQGSSELNISVVISQQDEVRALNAVHQAFFYPSMKTAHLFVLGTGQIGTELLRLINETDSPESTALKVCAAANSKKMMFDEASLDLSREIKEQIGSSGRKLDIDKFCRRVFEMPLADKIVVDCSASEDVSAYYPEFIKAGAHLVTANKIFNSSSVSDYLDMRKLLAETGRKFKYETNAGAALPVISTLRSLINSGDEIVKIEAVLSGTLSYIFNQLKPETKLSELVRTALEMGYTEPDPRIDLGGVDMARKLLILMRECGIKMELADIEIEPILPDKCRNAASVKDFFAELEKYDAEFTIKNNEVIVQGKKLLYTAVFKDARAALSLTEADSSHPFYSLQGADNIVSYTTKRYFEQPLVIRGPGAGAEVTAAGVLADIYSVIGD